jgi:hypothetical protein
MVYRHLNILNFNRTSIMKYVHIKLRGNRTFEPSKLEEKNAISEYKLFEIQ